jgi:predicted  nucleic acid-binding Zn-ribbon protein
VTNEVIAIVGGLFAAMVSLVLLFGRDKFRTGAKRFATHETQIGALREKVTQQEIALIKAVAGVEPALNEFKRYIQLHQEQHDKIDDHMQSLGKGQSKIQGQLEGMGKLLADLVTLGNDNKESL